MTSTSIREMQPSRELSLPSSPRDADVVSQALSRIAAHVADETANRLAWWSHAERASLRELPQWAVVVDHVMIAARLVEHP